MKMKKYLPLLLGGMLAFSSCSDYLDKAPDDMLTLEMVFKDKVRTEDWLAGLYTSIPSQWNYNHQEGPLGDDMNPSIHWSKFGWDVISKNEGNWNPSSSEEHDWWNVIPKRVRSALIFIDNVRPNNEQLVTQEEVDLMKLEARFMIAYYYAQAVFTFGPYPFNPDKLIDMNTSEEELMVTQAPVDSIIDWCDQEFLALSKALPPSYDVVTKFGRATSLMALAVRARLLLYQASPLLNGNPTYKDHVNSNNVHLFSQSYDPKKWARAAQASKDLITAAHAAGKDLYKVYNEDGTIDAFQSLQYMLMKKETEGNKEILFARPDWDHWSFNSHCTPRGCSGNGGYGVTQALVDAFFMENGLPPIIGYVNNDYSKPIINEKSGYVEKGFSTEAEFRNTAWIEAMDNNDIANKGMITQKP